MLRISLTYVNDFSVELHGVPALTEEQSLADVFFPLYSLRESLLSLLNQSIYSSSLRVCRAPGNKLIEAIRPIVDRDDWNEPIKPVERAIFNSALNTFQVTFKAELETMNAYFVTSKRGYEVLSLTDNASAIFPPDLLLKVPEVAFDIAEAGKCIAFEVTTAAGFHLLRAMETVITKFWDSVMKGAALPSERNLGSYIAKMSEAKVPGTEKVLAALKQIKDLHRNPLMHPEDRLNLDECIGLLNIVQSAMVAMLLHLPVIDIPKLDGGGDLS